LTASGAVESWLADLEAIMGETIRAEILRCHDDVMRIGKKREWIMGHKLQMLLVCLSVSNDYFNIYFDFLGCRANSLDSAD
jgi:hypothetical protein